MVTVTSLAKRPDVAEVQANIARALAEIKDELNVSYKDLETASGLDDSTICKLLDASRNVRLGAVEDICHGYNKIAGTETYTPAGVILKYNTPEDIEALPPKLGFTRFLDRHRQVPGPVTTKEGTAIRKLVTSSNEKKSMNGQKFNAKTQVVNIPETVIKAYVIEPMTSFKFVRDEHYVVRVGGDLRVLTFPFMVDGAAEFEVLGRVLDSSIK